MRIREFIIRIGIFVPTTIAGIALLFMILAIAASLFHFENLIFSGIYSTASIIVFATAIILVISFQARACCRKIPETESSL